MQDSLQFKLENEILRLDNGTGISHLLNSQQISVFPNPSSTSFSFELKDYQESFDIEITNTLGQLIYEENDVKISSIISSKNWSNGVYYISLKTETGAFLGSKKIVINR